MTYIIVELLVLPNATIAGTNDSSVVITCTIKNDIPGMKTISLIKNGIIVSSNNSNILTTTVLLTTYVYNQNFKCKADLDCLDMPLEQDVKFSVTCEYSRSFKYLILLINEHTL